MLRSLALVALAAALLPGAARPVVVGAGASPSSFRGLTSQRLRITFELAGDRRIEQLRVTYRAECGTGGIGFQLADRFHTRIAVAADGTFSVRHVGMRLAFRGRIDGRRASGTMRITHDYGGMFRCKTPILRWTAGA